MTEGEAGRRGKGFREGKNGHSLKEPATSTKGRGVRELNAKPSKDLRPFFFFPFSFKKIEIRFTNHKTDPLNCPIRELPWQTSD